MIPKAAGCHSSYTSFDNLSVVSIFFNCQSGLAIFIAVEAEVMSLGVSICSAKESFQPLVVYLHCSPGARVTNANLRTYFICVDGGMVSVRTASLCSLVFDESPDSARLTTPTVNEPMIRYKKD